LSVSAVSVTSKIHDSSCVPRFSFSSSSLLTSDAKIYLVACNASRVTCLLLAYTLVLLSFTLSWFQKWLFNLNTKKCCIVSYGRSVDKTVTYTLVDHSSQEAVLGRYDKVKDLGVWFDENLSNFRAGVFNLWSADPLGFSGSFQGIHGQPQKKMGDPSHFN